MRLGHWLKSGVLSLASLLGGHVFAAVSAPTEAVDTALDINPHHRLDQGYVGVTAGEMLNLKAKFATNVAIRGVWVIGEEFGYGFEYSRLLSPTSPVTKSSDPVERAAAYHYEQWGFVFEHTIRPEEKCHQVYGIFAGAGVGGLSNSAINDLPAAAHDHYYDAFKDKHMVIIEPRFSYEYNTYHYARLDYGVAARLSYGGNGGSAVTGKDVMGAYLFVTAKLGNYTY